MRLGQLSRKINVNSNDIIIYLEKDLKVVMNSHLNSKVEDQYVDLIISHFSAVSKKKPTKSIEKAKDDAKKELVEKTIEAPQKKAKVIKPKKSPKEVVKKVEVVKIETIKASAQKLDGLKVIGKIELPPPPPPEMIEIDGVMYDKQEVKKQRKEEKELRRKQLQKKKVESPNNPEVKNRIHPPLAKKHISFEEKKAAEDKDYLKRKRAEEKYQKEKQRKHYEKIQSLRPAVKNEKKKPNKKVTIEESENKIESKPAPKSLLGKFWRWLNT